MAAMVRNLVKEVNLMNIFTKLISLLKEKNLLLREIEKQEKRLVELKSQCNEYERMKAIYTDESKLLVERAEIAWNALNIKDGGRAYDCKTLQERNAREAQMKNDFKIKYFFNNC